MSRILNLSGIPALFRKLEREQYRAFHARKPQHKADHFVNFCVTAHALRDYLLEHLGKITDAEKQPYQAQWAAMPLLRAVGEVANSSKHLTLRGPTGKAKKRKTRRVAPTQAEYMDIYRTSGGMLTNRIRRGADIVVELSDGRRHDLHGFTVEVLTYWRDYLTTAGVRLRRQSLATLIDA